MVRLGVFVSLVLFVSLLIGCSEKATSVQETGLDLRFANCLTFSAWVWIDGGYMGSYTSEQPNIIDVPAGGHTLFVRGNIVVADTSYCWTGNFRVSEGQITTVVLDCRGAKCVSPAAAALNPPLEP
jgi:hypothetical protein